MFYIVAATMIWVRTLS